MSIISSTRCQTTSLPLELLIAIFELATYNSTREIDNVAELPPFESLYVNKRLAQDKDALQTKYSLALSCSLFRRLTMNLLYEDIWVRHGSGALLSTIQDSCDASHNNSDLGKYVRRVSLSPIASRSTVESTRCILSLCPNIRVLSRPLALVESNHSSDLTCDIPPINGLSFTQLHRVDWNNTLSVETSAAGHSPQSVWRSPSLRVLTLGKDNFPIPGRDIRSDEELEVLMDLPQLHTLRLHSCDALGDPDEFWFSIQLPSLCRIVLERPLALYALHAGCLSLYGTRITTFELGRYARFLRIDAVSLALGYCPNVETLLFPVFTTMPPAKNQQDIPQAEWVEYRVKRVGLNASVEEDCDYQVSKTWMWVQLGDLVDALFGEGTRFTALECITLYGSEWRELVQDSIFKPIVRAMHSNTIKIDCEDEVTGELIARLIKT